MRYDMIKIQKVVGGKVYLVCLGSMRVINTLLNKECAEGWNDTFGDWIEA